ncbi:hypothetical protein A1O1_00409 [Capronia coronata CBS 617.96]|uniref:Zn(2)-C6 fungal-type domain-containing protein n=1 Tax=Capronia coronata CBS 617.96 TaxID=1182541 RepID=W9ZL94_9EURO|nr:uncharacterized protein A1O1_00409 [Capronia coronata CBS 617.96]EXJ95289.1 hypothetical protein A1O1_00409 [Capronia coronata CBS 617.96]
MSCSEKSGPESTATSLKPRTQHPSLLACIPCRRSHLKCDGQTPLCSRCAGRKGNCFWVESRRGYREYRKQPGAHDDKRRQQSDASEVFQESQPAPTPPKIDGFRGWQEVDPNQAVAQAASFQELLAADPGFTSEATEYQNTVLEMAQNSSSPSNQSSPTMPIPRDTSLALEAETEAESTNLNDLFYKHFYHAHPFVVPRKMFLESPLSIPYPVHYLPQANRATLGKAAQVIFSDDVPDDGHKVQGLLLYAFVCYSRFDQEGGVAALDKAIEIAVRLGMNRASFAIRNGESNPTLQESWRRTWWTLLVIESMVSVVGGQAQRFKTYSIPTDVPLPGPDEDYNELGSFGHIWPRAMVTRNQVAKFAREVLTQPNVGGDPTSTSSSAMVQQFDSHPVAQLEYQFPSSSDGWMEQLLQPDSNDDEQLDCTLSLGPLSMTPAQAQGV